MPYSVVRVEALVINCNYTVSRDPSVSVSSSTQIYTHPSKYPWIRTDLAVENETI